MWPSWPQACILPGWQEAKGRPVASETGRASISARKARLWSRPKSKKAHRALSAGENTFSPEQQVTRQQVVTLLYSFTRSYLGLTPGAGADLSGYQDLGQVSSWALEAMAWAVGEGIVSSSSADALTLSPELNANRAEVATMLRAFSEKIL